MSKKEIKFVKYGDKYISVQDKRKIYLRFCLKWGLIILFLGALTHQLGLQDKLILFEEKVTFSFSKVDLKPASNTKIQEYPTKQEFLEEQGQIETTYYEQQEAINTRTSAVNKEQGYKTLDDESFNEKYTPYEVIVWHLKAHEGFRKNPYPDGEYPSIAFGYNFVHGKVSYPISWDNGTKLLNKMIVSIQSKIKKDYPHLNEWELAALTCRVYNRGANSFDDETLEKAHLLKGCCGKNTKGGSSCAFVKKCKHILPCKCKQEQAAVRKQHNKRRLWEYSLFTKKIPDYEQVAKDKAKCIKMENNAK